MSCITFHLPPVGHKVRENLDCAYVADCLSPDKRNDVPALRNAVALAERYMRSETACRSVETLCRTMDGHWDLIRVGRRGGWKRLWRFTKINPRYAEGYAKA